MKDIVKYYRLIKKLENSDRWFPWRITVGTILRISRTNPYNYGVYSVDGRRWHGLIDDVDLRKHFVELDEGMCKALYAT